MWINGPTGLSGSAYGTAEIAGGAWSMNTGNWAQRLINWNMEASRVNGIYGASDVIHPVHISTMFLIKY